jgi:hypothetical protein
VLGVSKVGMRVESEGLAVRDFCCLLFTSAGHQLCTSSALGAACSTPFSSASHEATASLALARRISPMIPS